MLFRSRVGVTPFTAAAAEKFDAQKFRAQGVENPSAEAVIAETLAPGLSFQGRILRPALVRLQDEKAAAADEPAAPAPEKSEAAVATDELPL